MKLKISKRMAFAIISVIDIAYTNSDKPIQTGDIASRHDIPRRYLEKVLQGLVKSDILKGTRGPGGGYILSREKRKITLADIAGVVIKIEELEQKKSKYNDELKSWVDNLLLSIWSEMNDMNMAYLEKITLQDLFKIANDNKLLINTADDQNNFMI